MKLGKILLPFALFMAAPLCACTPAVPKGNDIDDGDGDDTELEDLTIDEILEKLEETFDVEFEWDDYYSEYYAEFDTTESLKAAVENVVDKIDFLSLEEDIKEYDDDDISGWEAYLLNKDQSVEVNVYSYEYDGDNWVDIAVYEVGESGDAETAASWSDIAIDDYFNCPVAIPGPTGASQFEYYCMNGYAEVFAYDALAEDYADILENAGFEVELYDDDEGPMYGAFDTGETTGIYFYDDDGGLLIMIMDLSDTEE